MVPSDGHFMAALHCKDMQGARKPGQTVLGSVYFRSDHLSYMLDYEIMVSEKLDKTFHVAVKGFLTHPVRKRPC